MGIFTRQIEEEVRFDRGAWLVADDGLEGPVTSAGVRVNRKAALGLTTVWRCVDLLSSAVSQAPKDIILKIGGKSFPEYGKPTWLVTPNPIDPTYTSNDYFGQIALSLLLDGNYFVSVFPYVWDPQVLTVLDPTRVDVKKGPLYDLKDDTGKVYRRIGPMEMLHGTWLRPPGALRGLSPLETLRRGYGSAIAAEEHASRFFGQGAQLSFGVEVPGPMNPTKLDSLRDSLRAKYVGLSKSHAIGVLTDGAKFVGGLAPTPEQAQMLGTRTFSVEDLCRPYGVPPNMAGSQAPGASSYASADVWRDEFRDYAVLPLATRIEAQHNRLVSVPDSVSDPNATAQFKFNLDHVARTNLLTRYQAHAAGVQGGFLTPNEARGSEDLTPVPPDAKDPGDRLYMQRQMVPIGDLATTAPIPGAPVDASIPRVAPSVRSVAEYEPPSVRLQIENDTSMSSAVDRLGELIVTSNAALNDRSVAALEASSAMHMDGMGQMVASTDRMGNQIGALANVPHPVTIPDGAVNVAAPVVNLPAPIVNVTPSEPIVIVQPSPPRTKTVTRNKNGSYTVTEQ